MLEIKKSPSVHSDEQSADDSDSMRERDVKTQLIFDSEANPPAQTEADPEAAAQISEEDPLEKLFGKPAPKPEEDPVVVDEKL